MMTWVHDQVCKLTVIGKEQHTFTVLVQSANWINSLRYIFHKLRYALSAQLIAHGGNISTRFVQHDIILLAALLEIYPFAVDGNDIAVRIDFLS